MPSNFFRLNKAPISLSSTEHGYSIVECAALTALASKLVKEHISDTLERDFDDLSMASHFAKEYAFDIFREKRQRILGREATNVLINEMAKTLEFSLTRDFITDEEQLGYANIYWRLVRANHSADVGPVHADQWFWDLGHGFIEPGYTRVKVWMPLIQNDKNPGLAILPGSQLRTFSYNSRTLPSGKKKPLFEDQSVIDQMIAAPVKKGQAIVFNDRLLHGGLVTDIHRVSIEWTFACKNN